MTRPPATVVLDLEDSLWDVTDESHTAALRTAGRAGLVTLARTHPELFARRPIGVRINRISGPDAAPDLEALGRASRFAELDCVVATKVESGAHIRENLAGLRHHSVAYRSLIPIVETRAGMANLDDITDAARDAGIGWLVYGHFDYAWGSSRVTRRASDAIRRRLAGTGVPCALLEGTADGAGRPPVRADGLHLTPDGHRFVAERLYEGGMREWVGGLLERRARRASGAQEQQRPLEGAQGARPPSWLRSRG